MSFANFFGDIWNWVFVFCVMGCGATSYFIGFREGVKLGASAMYDHLVQSGSPNPKDPDTVIVELEKNSS